MAWLPISLVVPQYETASGLPASGYVLKAYQSGTSTNIPFATDSGGGTQVTSVALNSSGFPEVSGNVVIPHIDQTFKLALYPSQSAANANSGALWMIDGLAPVSNVAFGNAVNAQTANYTVLATDKGKLIYYSGLGGVTLTLLAAASAGDGFTFMVENDTSGTVTLDGDGSEQVNGATTAAIPASGFAIVTCNGTAWRALIGVTGDSTETLTNKTLTEPTITAPTLSTASASLKPLVKDHGTKSGNYTLQLDEADMHLVAFSANATLTIASDNTNDKAAVVVKSGGNTITLSGIDNDSPTLTASASKQDFLALIKSFGKITCVAAVLNKATT